MKVSRLKVHRRLAVAVSAAAVVAGLAACGSSGTTGSAGTSGAANAAGAAGAAGSAGSAGAAQGAATSAAGSHTSAKAGKSASGCPDPSAVSAAAGTQVSAPQVTSHDGTLLCSYSSGGGVLAISREGDAEYDADTVKSALESQAQALGLAADSVKRVSGLGDAAYEFTQDSGTTLGIVSGTAYIAVIGAPSATAAKAVAKLVLG